MEVYEQSETWVFWSFFFDVSKSSNHRKIKSKSSITTKKIITSKSSNHKKILSKCSNHKKII